MRVFYDGLIYAMQSVGGVGRIYNELIPRVAAAPGVQAALSLRLLSRPPVPMPNVRKVRFLALPDPYASTNPLRRVIDGAVRQMDRGWCRLRAGRPDVYHPTYYMTPRFRGVPTVVTVYDMIHERFPEFYPTAEHARFRAAKAACIRAADHVLCISEATRRDVVELLGIPPEKTTVTLLGSISDDTNRSPKRSEGAPGGESAHPRCASGCDPATPFEFLFIGQRWGYKNAGRLVSAMSDRRLAGCRLLLVGGEDPRPEDIERGRDGRTAYAGRVSDAELGELYRRASAVVCPSLYEGFGLPVLEAMAEGAVVACSNTSSLPEVAGDCAFYFDPRSRESVAEALVKAMSLSDAERKAWGERAKARAALFSWDKTAEQTLAVYRQVAG